jgi:DNA-nicking Smr family endonuclease
MARRKKSGRGQQDQPVSSKPPPDATTSLGSLLKAAGMEKLSPAKPTINPRTLPPPGPESLVPVRPPPAAPHTRVSPAAELRMINDAYAGARPIFQKGGRPSTPPRPVLAKQKQVDQAEEIAARARLAALVSGGVRFKISQEDDHVEGVRQDASPKLLARLSGKGFAAEATLDLHGQRVARVADLVAGFVRTHHRRGARNLLIIAGKGLHSEDGVGVLRHALIEALTQGLAAPLILAFSSAHSSLGGSGALAVLLS